MPAIAGAAAVVGRIGLLVAAAARLQVPVTVTEQYPEGLGPTLPSLAGQLPEGAAILAKTHFSGLREPAIAERLGGFRAQGRDQTVVCGCEAHVCLMQTALGLSDLGYEVFLAADAISSRARLDAETALARLRGEGCRPVTAEMVVFEWLARGPSADFRALLPLIK